MRDVLYKWISMKFYQIKICTCNMNHAIGELRPPYPYERKNIFLIFVKAESQGFEP